MSVITVFFAVFLPVVCIIAATALMRLFDVKDATPEQTQSEVEELLSRVNREVKVRRRVRAGAPGNAALAEFPRFPVYAFVKQPERGTNDGCCQNMGSDA
jgi:hypothetical protein